MQILLRITGMALRYRGRLSLAYLTFFASIFFSMLVVWLLAESINMIVVTGEGGEFISLGDVDRTRLIWMALGLMGASIMRGLFDFARTYTTDSLSQKVAYDLRNDMYDKLQHLSFAFHDKEHTGNLMSKVTADIEAVRRFIMMGLVRSFEVGIRIIAITCILVFINWELALMSLAFVPFLVYRSTKVQATMRVLWTRVQEVMGQSVTILQENLSGIHVVKAFAAEDHESKKYAVKAQELSDERFRSERLQGTESAWMTLYFTLALGLILWYGGWELIRGDLRPGHFTAFILLLNQLTFPIRMMPFIINSFSRAVSSGQRLFEVLDARSPVEESSVAKDMGRTQGHVRFNDVSFSYDHQAPALDHINLSVPQGSVVALLGAPGSGKSTIVNLLPRFYDATQGQITIDGKDIRDFTLASLRRNVGIVQQDVFLFTASIKDNIAYGIMDASFEDVVRAAKVAQLHDHIISLPDGYNTWVGERGVTLSGGQRQRLSMARTLLIDPPVLILDDSTSSVDVETERLIHRAMTQVMEGRTTFVIAHRLSSVREADLILVLKDGRIVEQGTHQELSSQGGIYQDIYELQLRPQQEVLLDAALPSEASPVLSPQGRRPRGEAIAEDNGGNG